MYSSLLGDQPRVSRSFLSVTELEELTIIIQPNLKTPSTNNNAIHESKSIEEKTTKILDLFGERVHRSTHSVRSSLADNRMRKIWISSWTQTNTIDGCVDESVLSVFTR